MSKLKSEVDRLRQLVQSISEIIEESAQLKEAKRELLRRNAFLDLLKRIAVAANEATSIEDAMQFAIDTVCGFTGWPVGHLYTVSTNVPGLLVPTRIWHLTSAARFATFRRVTELTSFPPGIGLPGSVLQEGRPKWILDVTKDHNFPRARMAAELGVASGFAFPVLIGREVVAVLEFFSEEPVPPDAPLLEVMVQIGTLLGRVIERVRHGEERDRLLHRASEKQALMEAVVQQMPAGVILVDADSHRLLMANEHAQRIYGTREGGMERVEDHPVLRAVARGETIVGEQIRFVQEDGTRGVLELNAAPVYDSEGRIIAVVAAFVDVTRRIRDQEERARLHQETERALKQREDLIGIVSHDLKNPLLAIRLSAELGLKVSRDTSTSPLIIESLERIRQTADRMDRLIRDLLDLAKIEAGGLVLDLGEHDARELMVESLKDLQPIAAGKSVRLELDLSTPSCRITCDPERLTQVLANLVSNAIRFSPPGGRVRVGLDRCGREESVFSVRDSGPGIPESQREQLFNRYWQAKKERRAGAGLGLSIAKGIVDAHGGRIWAENAPEGGAIFRFTLPSAESRLASA